MSVYVGVDLHRNQAHLVAMDEKGNQLASKELRTRPEEFAKAFRELGSDEMEVAFEATFGWGWFADLLDQLGIAGHMAHPMQTKAISTARVKNDSVDAKTLAHLLRTNLLPESWMAPPEVREARRLVRMRQMLVRVRSRMKQQVHAVLAEHGIHPPAKEIFVSSVGRAFLEDADLPSISRGRVDACLRLIDGIDEEVERAEMQMKELFNKDDRVRKLMAIPGIGFLTAVMVVAEVWDVSRFSSADQLCCWAGLTPRERSSAGKTRKGHITKQGSMWLRWALVEAATSPYVTRQPRYAELLRRIRRRHGSSERRAGNKIARVALARHMLKLCYYALRDPNGCRDFPV